MSNLSIAILCLMTASLTFVVAVMNMFNMVDEPDGWTRPNMIRHAIYSLIITICSFVSVINFIIYALEVSK